jgi:hypothetical protein
MGERNFFLFLSFYLFFFGSGALSLLLWNFRSGSRRGVWCVCELILERRIYGGDFRNFQECNSVDFLLFIMMLRHC